MAEFTDWAPYVAYTTGAPPKPLYQAAVALFDEPATALDFGCGAGNETLDLLHRGWRVHAVDSSDAALQEVTRRTSGLTGLTVERSVLWEAQPPVVHFAYAGFSLFFAPPERFAATWAVVAGAVRSGGVFAGQFLGVEDDWAGLPGITSHEEAEVRELLGDWSVLQVDEVQVDGRAMSGPKHWHLFNVLARRL